MERGPLYNWHDLKSWGSRSTCTSVACMLGVDNADCPWLLDCKHDCLHACDHLSRSFLLPSSHFLVHSASPCICYLASFPTRFADGKRGFGSYPAFLISQTGCILQQASLKIVEIITVVYFIHTHTHTHIYVFLYIYSSVSLCSWETHPGFISVMRKGR